MSSISTTQALTNQFYQWEQRGRGWHLSAETVSLEPVFEPFWGHFLEGEIIDDGRQPHWLDSFLGRTKPNGKSIEPAQAPDIAFPYDDSDTPLTVFALTIPRAFKASSERMEQVLIMLLYRKSPISFEIIASAETITLQVTCREYDEGYLHNQLKAFFPDIQIQVAERDALLSMLEQDAAFYTVDFGLQDEFMRPLASGSGGEPYTSLFGILEHLYDEQHIAIQILFSGTHNDWSESITTAVCDEGGKGSFLLNDPDMPHVAKEKISRPLFGVTIKAVSSSDELPDALTLLHHTMTALVHASTSPYNAIMPLAIRATDPEYSVEQRLTDIVLRQTHRTGMLLNSRELSTFVHFPAVQSIKLIQTAQHTKAAPVWLRGHPFVLGANSHNGSTVDVSMHTDQRLRHTHIIGATGTGKSTFLHSLILHDIVAGNGLMVLDPHGDLITAIVQNIPEDRIKDVVYIDPTDREYTTPFNILSAHSELEKELLASDLVALFKRFSTSWGDQLHSVLSNAVLACLYNSKVSTLSDLRRFLIEPAFRTAILVSVTDPDIVYYWQKEYPLLKTSSIGSIITRLDSFLRPKVIRAMVSQKEGLNLAEYMDSKKIILVKLSQGLLGSENSFLLGAFLVSKLQQIAMSRQAQELSARIPFFCYIDEFHHFITPSMASILSGARKFALGLIVAHQDLQQVQSIDGETLSSLLANAGTRVCFRLGDTDAKRLQEGFSAFSAEDLQNLGTGQAIARVSTREGDFNIAVIPFVADSDIDHTEAIIAHSRATYSVPVPTMAVPVFEPEQPKPVKSERTVTPAVIPVAAAPVPQPPLAQIIKARESKEHRHTQMMIKKMAEEHGYVAKLEVPTPDGQGQVDVLLEKDGHTTAVEISVSTSATWEMHNIEKCLLAGYTRIVVCTDNAAKQKALENSIAQQLSPANKARVQVMTSSSVHTLFAAPKPAPPTDTIIKGYRVKVNYEENANRQDLLQSIIKATRKTS
jgi:hypothetical protein